MCGSALTYYRLTAFCFSALFPNVFHLIIRLYKRQQSALYVITVSVISKNSLPPTFIWKYRIYRREKTNKEWDYFLVSSLCSSIQYERRFITGLIRSVLPTVLKINAFWRLPETSAYPYEIWVRAPRRKLHHMMHKLCFSLNIQTGP